METEKAFTCTCRAADTNSTAKAIITTWADKSRREAHIRDCIEIMTRRRYHHQLSRHIYPRQPCHCLSRIEPSLSFNAGSFIFLYSKWEGDEVDRRRTQAFTLAKATEYNRQNNDVYTHPPQNDPPHSYNSPDSVSGKNCRYWR